MKTLIPSMIHLLYVFASPARCLSLLDLCPPGVKYRWNYCPDHAPPLVSSPATGVLSDLVVWGSQFSLCSLPPLFCCSSRKGTPRAASKASCHTPIRRPSSCHSLNWGYVFTGLQKNFPEVFRSDQHNQKDTAHVPNQTNTIKAISWSPTQRKQ